MDQWMTDEWMNGQQAVYTSCVLQVFWDTLGYFRMC